MSIQTQQEQSRPSTHPLRPKHVVQPRLHLLRHARRAQRSAAPGVAQALLAARIMPRGATRREMAALETIMANLALDERHAIALELVGDETGVSLLVRAATPAALAHLVSQLQALYPQARIDLLPAEADPLRLAATETYAVMELALGAPSYLSLRTWDTRAAERRDAEGTDPLLAVLSALQHLPPGTRTVSQLALLPARPTWSAPYARKAVEHPLEPERTAQRQRHASSGPSMGLIGVLALVVVVALLVRRFGAHLLPLVPAWVKRDVPGLLRGHVPSLTPPELLQVALLLGLILVGAFLVHRLMERLQGQHPLYDMRQVGEKTKRVAYRARLRLYVIGERSDLAGEDLMGVACDQETECDQVEETRLVSSDHEWSQTRSNILLPSRLACAVPAFPSAGQQERVKHVQRWWNKEWSVWKAYGVQWCNKRARNRLCRRACRARAEERQQILAQLAASYRQYHQAWGNYLVPHRLYLRHAHLLVPPIPPSEPSTMPAFVRNMRRLTRWLLWGKASWDKDLARCRQYLSVAELASLWHLPPEQDIPDVPFLEHGGARTRLVPQVLTGLTITQGGTPEAVPSGTAHSLLAYQLGTSTHAGQSWPVYVPRDLLHSNTLAVAATGKGKSTLFQHLSLAHLTAHKDEGLFFMEPHGDTIASLLGAIPACRQDDVTLIDLADATQMVGINPLDMTQGIGRDKTVENILGVFVAFWQKQHSWGPRTENILQFALLTLAEANQARLDELGEELGAMGQYTVLDVIPLLQQAQYRSSILKTVRDAVLLEWWTGYYNPMRQGFRDEVISPVINKISKYAAAQVSRRLLGQSKATIRLREDIAEGRPILINTASGIVGEEISALAGATLVGLFQAALAEQARLPLHERRRYLVFVDEFQTYLGIDYPTMLAELRKYGGTFGLATQSLSYLHEVDPSLKATVLSNVNHLFAFAMSAEDAKALAPYLDGLEIADVLSLDSYTCYARLTHEGQRLPTFSMQIASPPAPDAEHAAWIRHHSQERHARPVGIVDEELAHAAYAAHLPPTALPKEAEPAVDAHDISAEPEQAPAAEPASRRVHGERGKGADTRSRGSRRAASRERYEHPAALSPRERPRGSVWYDEHAERDERGEPGGE